jgi:deoxyribonuclease IV
MSEEQQRSFLTYDPADEYRPDPPPPPEIPFWKDGSIRIGIHTSIAGDIVRALDLAYGLGANALQIFSSSPRMWERGNSRISDPDAKRFRERRRQLGLGPLVVHDNYLINLASPNPVLRTRSVQAFHQEIVRATALGADYLVAHPGSGRDGTREAAIGAIVQGLRQAVRGLKLGSLQILLENTAGHGTSLGSRFEELKAILDACPELPLGVCIDTAHLFASGWDIRRQSGLDATLAKLDESVGLRRVLVIHANDSKTALGSRVDRHQHIGKGRIGRDAFRNILNHPLLAGKVFIAETPIDKPGDDRRNVAALWALAGKTVISTGSDGMKPRKARGRETKDSSRRKGRKRTGGKGRASRRA